MCDRGGASFLPMIRLQLALVFFCSLCHEFCHGWTTWPSSQSTIRPRAAIVSLGSFDPSASESTDIADDNSDHPDVEETIRVRIWRALAAGDELTLKELGKAVGHHRDLRSHLRHVARQAETLKNKSDEWRERRGLPIIDATDSRRMDKLRLRIRNNGNRSNEMFVRLE